MAALQGTGGRKDAGDRAEIAPGVVTAVGSFECGGGHVWGVRLSLRARDALPMTRELHAGELIAVHLIRSVGDAEHARGGVREGHAVIG